MFIKIHNKCISLTKDKKILTFDQATVIDTKADSGTYAQKEYLNNFLAKEKDVQELAQQFPERADFENALDNVLKELDSNSVKQTESAALTQQNTLNNSEVGEVQQSEGMQVI